MTNTTDLRKEAADFLKSLKEYALTVGEPCPEGHVRDAASGACLPVGPLDHTAFTRSLNDDQGDEWRGLAAEEKTERAVDASEMEDFQSCAAGTTFSFIQKRCVSFEEAEAENSDEFAMASDTEYVEVEEGAAPGQGGHKEITLMQPEGRRDTINHECPPNQFFDYKLRECIPLNKDTVMASEDVDEEFKKAVAMHLSGRLACTSPDPLDGHKHLVTVDENGDGKTSVAVGWPGKESYPHSHDVKGYVVSDYTDEDGDYTSRHFGHVIPKEMWEYQEGYASDALAVVGSESAENQESAAPITTKQRKGLPDSAFGVPGKRKFPLDTCARVRNAMARFNQAKGLTSGEKATLRRKILAAAGKCGIEVRNFAKAETAEEFATVTRELLAKERVMSQYSADTQKETSSPKQGPCPPGMEWEAARKGCKKTSGFYNFIKDQGSHADVIANDPSGRKDTPGFQCPDGFFFDFKNRKCLALDPSRKDGTSTSKASVEKAVRDLAPNPKGRPARLPQDCPPNTIWDADLNKCKPLDSRKKTKSSDETAGREGLTPAPAGKVKLPADCPPNTMWDGVSKTCTPMDSRDKNRPSGASPQSPKSFAEVDGWSVAKLIQHLDAIIREDVGGSKEKAKVAAKNLPNEAFPPSLVGSTRRSLMHHTFEVADAYDNGTVDVARLRNALARVDGLDGYSAKAVEDAREHLIYHAREIIKASLGKN